MLIIQNSSNLRTHIHPISLQLIKWMSTGPVFKVAEVERFAKDCVLKVGSSEENAEIFSKVLIRADRMGIKTHGLNRLEMYIREIQNKVCDPKAKPTVEKETVATALVNGHNSLGHIVGKFAMETAIAKAKKEGVGMAASYDGIHYGVAGVYTMQAVDAGLIGFTFTNTSPLVVPWGGKDRALGTNPFSIAAPGLDGDCFVLDMSTSEVAVGKVEVLRKKGLPVPPGWAINVDGSSATDAEKVVKDPRLLPFGSPECGHIGYGLSVMVEMITGVLSGADFGPFIKEFTDPTRKSNLGYSFIAIDPTLFNQDFKKRISQYLNHIRSLPPIVPNQPVLIAGDMERINLKKTDEIGVLDYPPMQVELSAKLAKSIGVTPLTPV